ncbi:MAG: methyltransferase domain-containing protein [Phycisphaerales bacterium]|nr:methyltransferase domain-containing protein [Phycisphaerales bacterium]
MKTLSSISLADVQAVYSGAEGNLWKLIMGEQIHIGGLTSSMDLAKRANIKAGWRGVDLCSCTGAGMRFLTRFCNVAHMTGVDATPHMVEQGKKICKMEGLDSRIDFVLEQATSTGLAAAAADFVWGEDAWCYVADKEKLIAEAARLVKPGGAIAFTDWVEGPGKLTAAETERFLRFMKFPSFADISDYSGLLRKNGCEVLVAEDTGRYAGCIDLYLNMLNMQLTYDALKIIGFDQNVMAALAGEMVFIQQLAHAKKIVQGIFVARKA